MFIGRAEANWWVLYFSTFISFILGNNTSSLEKVRNESDADADASVLDDDPNSGKDMHDDVVNGPTVLAHVELARTVRKFLSPRFVLGPPGFDLKTLLQIANFLLLNWPPKLANLISSNMFDDSSMISYILVASSLHLTYL